MTPMTPRARFATLVLPLLFVSAAGAGCDIAMADYKQKETAEWRKTYDLQPGGRVAISNVNGKIDVELSTGNAVEVIAEKTARAGSSEAAKEALDRIEIAENVSPGEVRIETKTQRGSGGLISRASQQVHYIVKVPTGAEVNFRTVNGAIELTGLNDTLRVSHTRDEALARLGT